METLTSSFIKEISIGILNLRMTLSSPSLVCGEKIASYRLGIRKRHNIMRKSNGLCLLLTRIISGSKGYQLDPY